jgi:hypothetical protein
MVASQEEVDLKLESHFLFCKSARADGRSKKVSNDAQVIASHTARQPPDRNYHIHLFAMATKFNLESAKG